MNTEKHPKVTVVPDVVLETICGEHILVGLRQAGPKLAYARAINDTAAFFFEHLSKGEDFDTIVEQTLEVYEASREVVETSLEGFIQKLDGLGYIVHPDSDDGQSDTEQAGT